MLRIFIYGFLSKFKVPYIFVHQFLQWSTDPFFSSCKKKKNQQKHLTSYHPILPIPCPIPSALGSQYSAMCLYRGPILYISCKQCTWFFLFSSFQAIYCFPDSSMLCYSLIYVYCWTGLCCMDRPPLLCAEQLMGISAVSTLYLSQMLMLWIFAYKVWCVDTLNFLVYIPRNGKS